MWFANLVVHLCFLILTSELPIIEENRAQMTPPTQLVKREEPRNAIKSPAPCQKCDENHRPSSQKKKKKCTYACARAHTHTITCNYMALRTPLNLGSVQRSQLRAPLSRAILCTHWNPLPSSAGECRLLGRCDESTFKHICGHSVFESHLCWC